MRRRDGRRLTVLRPFCDVLLPNMAVTFLCWHGPMQSPGSYRLNGLAANVGADFRRRAMPSSWMCLGLVMAVGAAFMAVQPGMQALAVLALAVLCHRAFRQPALVPLRRPGFAAMLLLAASSALGVVAGLWVARGLAELGGVIAVVQAAGYAACVSGFSVRLQAVVDSLEDAELLAVLPAEAAAEARRWMAGDERDAGRLAVVVPLAALHVAQRRCDVRVRGGRALLQG